MQDQDGIAQFQLILSSCLTHTPAHWQPHRTILQNVKQKCQLKKDGIKDLGRYKLRNNRKKVKVINKAEI